jgi:hypothetical protein
MHISPQFIDQKRVSLVSSIIANLFSQQALADAESDDGFL